MCALDQTGHTANSEPPQLAERLAMTGIRDFSEAAGSANLVMDLPAHWGLPCSPWGVSERLQHLLLRAKKSTVAR